MTFLAFKLSDVAFILLINVKMATIVAILRFMSMSNFVLSKVEHDKYFITSGPGLIHVQFGMVHCIYQKGHML